MPACTTPLLCEDVSRAMPSWRSSTSTERSRASRAATARPTTPAPTTTISASKSVPGPLPSEVTRLRLPDLAGARHDHPLALVALEVCTALYERVPQRHVLQHRPGPDHDVRPQRGALDARLRRDEDRRLDHAVLRLRAGLAAV